METRVRIKIVKDNGVTYAQRQTCSQDGTVLFTESIDMPDATGHIKDNNLVQMSKTTSKSGATTYIYY